TMCAFDVCIAAPKCTLIDIVLRDGKERLGDAITAYAYLISLVSKSLKAGFRLVVTNSWSTQPYSPEFRSNLDHPLHENITSVDARGADIVVAFGNSGTDCLPPGTAPLLPGAFGHHAHPSVLSVAMVDINKVRLGLSSVGPGSFANAKKKPDISGYSHFA